jgi:8-amino-7-oxononanoate synthase
VLDWISHELAQLDQQGLTRDRRTVAALGDGWCLVDGKRLRNFAANDYLNLAHDSRIVSAARNATDAAGFGAGASPLVSGRTPHHAALEERLTRFEAVDGVVLFPSGYAANVGAIRALAGPGDTVYCDRHNHASLYDGCRISGARLRVYRHDDLGRLERELGKPANGGRRLIVTDSVFSMEGDLAPLSDLGELARRFGCMLLVDEAHATGLFGLHGRGVAEHLRAEALVTVRVGTLSKALGSIGGFVAGPRPVIDWLWNRARTQVYSTALPAAACAAAMAALDLVETEPARRRHLLELAAQLRGTLDTLGLRTISGGAAPIVPVLLETPALVMRAAAALEARGFLVGAIRPPSVPRGTARLRITLSSAFSPSDIDALAEALQRATRP